MITVTPPPGYQFVTEGLSQEGDVAYMPIDGWIPVTPNFYGKPLTEFGLLARRVVDDRDN